ncbi:hypothetical protein C8R43DRAFT_869416, partial [Mycena crocata]
PSTSEPSQSESKQQDPSPSTPSDATRPFQCLHAGCPRWFKRTYTRGVHMRTHRPNENNRKFACTFEECSLRFSRKHDRLRHEVGSHGMSTQWSCGPCNKYFSSQNTLERHISDKHDLI